MKASENFFVLENTMKRRGKIHTNKWDKYLDDYDNYINEYRKHYENSQNGDEISLSLYPYMRAKCEDLRDLIINAYDKKCLTKKQVKRVIKINMKIVKSCF
jgi:hypothetical protein